MSADDLKNNQELYNGHFNERARNGLVQEQSWEGTECENHRVRGAGRLGMRARPQVVTGEECAVLYTSLWACRPQSRRVTRPLWRRGGGERWCSNWIKKLWRGNQKCVKGNVIKFLLCEVRCDSSSISLGNILQTIHIKVRREGGREGSHLEATRSLG